jgi:hypothetical protein
MRHPNAVHQIDARPDAEVAVVTGDTLVEFVFGQEVGELGEDGATFVHKVINRQRAVEHPQGAVAELKSKNAGQQKTAGFTGLHSLSLKP